MNRCARETRRSGSWLASIRVLTRSCGAQGRQGLGGPGLVPLLRKGDSRAPGVASSIPTPWALPSSPLLPSQGSSQPSILTTRP